VAKLKSLFLAPRGKLTSVVRSNPIVLHEVAKDGSADKQIGEEDVWGGSALMAAYDRAARFGQAQAPDVSGAYRAPQYHAKIQLVGGGDLPLTPDGKTAYERNMA
jgi:hypothetical protein